MVCEKFETTLIQIFSKRVKQNGDQAALHIKHDGVFKALTWNEIAVAVRQTALALQSLGVRPGDRVVQIAENRFEWIVMDLAIQMAQAIHVPLHASLAGEQIVAQIVDCGAVLAVIEDRIQAKKLLAVADQLPSDTRLLSYELIKQRIGSHSVKQLSQIQDNIDPVQGEALEQAACEQLTPKSIATILYTSGTTGVPKGVVLSQRNLVSNTLGTIDAFGDQPSDLRLCFLPLSHIFARTCDLYTWIARGSELALADSRETILHDCVRLGPTMLNGVPYFFQRVRRYLVDHGRENEQGSLHKVLGGKIRLCCSGGAALPDYLYDFFHQHEIPLLQGYGLTESSPVIALNSPEFSKRGTVGKPIPGVKVRIAEDGEVLAAGPNIMVGYWGKEEATNEIIRNGWLHTGDLGQIDDDGFLKITGRRKHIIVTAAGKNVAPAQLERLICEDPLIAQAVVIGDGRNYLSALIVPDPVNIRRAVKKLRILPISKKWVLSHPKVLALYGATIQRRLAGVSHHEQVRKFTVMDRGFTIETGEMTPKLSLKRELIQRNCSKEIEAMYQKHEEDRPFPKQVLSFVRSLWLW